MTHDIINHSQDEPTPSFDSTVWSYDHASPHTYIITTHILTTLQTTSDFMDDITVITTHTTTPSLNETELCGHSSLKPNNFFDIHHTLTGDISQVPLKCLASVYDRLKETKRRRYSIITLQMLFWSLVISVCGYNPLCSQIPTVKCLQFDRALYAKYIKDTKPIVTQPARGTFLSCDHHGLHISSLIMTQLQGRARELDVRLNSTDTAQKGPPMARLAVTTPTLSHRRNLIRDTIVNLV